MQTTTLSVRNGSFVRYNRKMNCKPKSQDYLLKILKKENNKIQICDVAVHSEISLKSEETFGNSKEIVFTQNLGMTDTTAQTSDGEILKKYAGVLGG